MTQMDDSMNPYDHQTEFRREEQHLGGVVESIDAEIVEREGRGPAQAGHAKAADILQELRNIDLQKLQSARNRPYFGRIDYAEGDRGVETIYIGEFNVQNDDPRYFIASRNAPIAELYYRPAEGRYEAPNGPREASVDLKRMLAIDDTRLLDFEDVLRLPAGPYPLRSRLLDAKLAAAGGRELADAVQTIQDDQYRQIASAQQPVLIVQGAAGSGKSLIGLHRIDFILSPYSNIGSMRRPTAERVIMFGPSPAFLQYVSGLLPGLGVERVRQTTTTKWMLSQFSGRVTVSRQDRVFEDLMNNRRRITAAENKAHRFKAGLGMKRLIDNYVKRLCKETPERVNRAGGMSIATRPGVASNRLSASDLTRRVKEAFGAYDQPNAARRHLINALAREWARANRRRSELLSEAIQEGRRAVERSLAPLWKAIDFRTEYAGLVSSSEKIIAYSRRGDVDRGMAGEIAKTAPPGAGQALGVTDLAAALYLDYVLNGFRSQGFEHVVIDEAQDISPLEILLMEMHSETRTFTILGDLRQSVLPHKSISNWNEIASLFPRKGVSRLESRLTYRSTRQITQYANRILQRLPDQTKMPMPYRQSGDRPRLVRSRSAAEMRKAVADSVRNLTNRVDVQTVAVLTKWRKTADDIGKTLRDAGIESVGALTSEGVIETDVTVSPIVLTKGLEFDAVIVANVHKDNFNDRDFDRMLFYLACTRARHHLEIHWYGARSPIVPDVARLTL